MDCPFPMSVIKIIQIGETIRLRKYAAKNSNFTWNRSNNNLNVTFSRRILSLTNHILQRIGCYEKCEFIWSFNNDN